VPHDLTPENVATAPGADQRVVLVYATFPDAAVAGRIGGEIVEAGLAACVNVFPEIRSIYRWQGAIQRDGEAAALIKTRRALVPRVVGWLLVAHPYVAPAAVVLSVSGGSPAFLDWIVAQTSDPQP
jgi:periplasmic divalent cation tolerance protein